MKLKIIDKSYESAANIIAEAIIKADPIVEEMKCIFTLVNDEDNIIHIMNALDFANDEPSVNDIKSFTLCQVIKK